MRSLMRVVAYCRVSTSQQAEMGVSLDAQEARVRQYCELFSLQLIEVITEEASAKTMHREGLRRALAMLADGRADGVIVLKLDRLTRSVRDLAAMVDTTFATAALISVQEQVDTSSACGRLVLNMLMATAQWEREAIGERTRAALAHKKALNERVGSITFGKRLAADGIHLVEEASEQEIIAKAHRLLDAGYTVSKIAVILNRSGHRSRNGKPFFAKQIARMARDQLTRD